MLTTIYWQAPLWQVLVVGLASALVLTWLARRALARPDPATALAAVDPVLDEQPPHQCNAVRQGSSARGR